MHDQRDTDSPGSEQKLSLRELHEAEWRASPSAAVIHEAIRLEGEQELARRSSSVAWSGLGAGLTMGFSLVAEGLLRAKLPEAPWRDLVTSFGYTAGFLFVTLGRQQLFTETTLTATLPAFHSPRRVSAVARFWAVVFFANVVGTILFALGAALPGVFADDAREAFLQIGLRATEGGPVVVFLQAIVAGWLIALMVWLLPAASSARFFVIIAATYLIGLAGLAHVIAGSAEVAYAAVVGGLSWTDYALGFLVPALLGNAVGGVVLVAALNHLQAKDEV